jgi:D-alanyl-D-alanine carboxypeptidase
VPAATSVAAGGSLAQSLAPAFQDVVDTRRAAWNVPGVSAAVILGDGSRWAGVSGRSSIAPDQSVASTTPFVVGSITKTFVASLILELRDDGVLGLDDPLADWLPSYPNAANITIRQLLSHTSGVFDYFAHPDYSSAVFGDPSHAWTPTEILTRFARAPYFPPGTGFHYSNTNFVLLGLVAEAAGGAPIAAQLRSRFWAPLGLDQTYIQSEGTPPTSAARGYWWVDGKFVDKGDQSGYRPTRSAATVAWNIGDMVASAPDIATWAHALYGGSVLSPASLAEMTDWQANPGDGDYGLGMRVRTYEGRVMFGHTGSIRGYTAVAWYVPSEDATFVVLTNRGRSNAFEAILNGLVDVVFSGVDLVAPTVPSGVAAAPRSGRYVKVTWAASTDNVAGPIRYRVFRDGSAVGTTSLLVFTDRPRVGRHTYKVRAIDVAGNRSGKSRGVTVGAFR